MSAPGGLGDTAGAYSVHSFAAGMASLAQLFQLHPELRGVRATVDQVGHVDIVAIADRGVLRDWVRALPDCRHTRDLFTVHYGHEWEEVLTSGAVTVHVRPVPKAGV